MKGLKKQWFTLIEVMAAMAVIIIVVGFGVKGMQWAKISSSETATEAVMQHAEQFLVKFKAKKGYYPQFISSDNKVIDPIMESKDGDLIIVVEDELSSNYLPKAEVMKMFENYTQMVERGYILEEDSTIAFLDGFGRALQYRFPGKHNINSYDLFSPGNDGYFNFEEVDTFYDDELEAGNADNIKNWK